MGFLKGATDWFTDRQRDNEVRIVAGAQTTLADVEKLCRRAREAGAKDNALFQSPTGTRSKNPEYIAVRLDKTVLPKWSRRGRRKPETGMPPTHTPG